MDRKKLGIAGLIVLLLAAFYFLAFKGGPGEDETRKLGRILKTCPKYDIDVTFYPDQKKIEGMQRVIVTNEEQTRLEALYFHLYPNAFKSPDTAPFPKSEMAAAYPEGFSPGYIDILKVEADSGALKYEIDGTMLKVDLPQPLKPGEQIKLNMKFVEVIPPSQGRFGYGRSTFNIANWYPILAVYDENGWNKDPYYAVGDPFYSDVGTYTVKIKAPAEYTIAAGGSLAGRKEEGEFNIWTFKTDLVRDFAWVASRMFRTASQNVGAIKVTSYYIEGDETYGKKALEFAAGAIKFYSDYFGPYPYKDYSVVESDFYIGGMEYPNLVMIGRQFYNQGELLEYVVAHETAHQWWYGLVGNNEVREPWLDEALTEYSTVLYYEKVYGKKTGERVYTDFILNPYRFYELSHTPGPVLRPLSDFSSWQDYDALVYSRGAIILRELENRMGKVKFKEALRHYFKQNLFKNATTRDFIKAVNQVTGADWSELIYKMLKSGEPLEKAA